MMMIIVRVFLLTESAEGGKANAIALVSPLAAGRSRRLDGWSSPAGPAHRQGQTMKPGLLQWVELEIPAYLTMLALGVLLFFILSPSVPRRRQDSRAFGCGSSWSSAI